MTKVKRDAKASPQDKNDISNLNWIVNRILPSIQQLPHAPAPGFFSPYRSAGEFGSQALVGGVVVPVAGAVVIGVLGVATVLLPIVSFASAVTSLGALVVSETEMTTEAASLAGGTFALTLVTAVGAAAVAVIAAITAAYLVAGAFVGRPLGTLGSALGLITPETAESLAQSK